MSTHANAETLLLWLRERKEATVGEITTAGLMSSRTASDAIRYAIQNGALERLVLQGMKANERVRYRITDVALPTQRSQAQPSFDGLLSAWGIALEPLPLVSTGVRRHQLSDEK